MRMINFCINYIYTKTILLYLFIFFVYTSIFLFSYYTTELPSYEKIPLMDGNQYLKMYHYFSSPVNSEYLVNFPYNSRVLYIWIASFFPESISPMNIFIILNYFFGITTLFLLFNTWNRLSIPNYQSLFILGYICLHWSGIIRQYMIDPVGVDLPYLFCLAILVNMIVFENFTYLFAVAIIGTATKEAIIPFILFIFLIKLYQKKIILLENKKISFNFSKTDNTIKKIAIALLLSILCKIIINQYFPAVQAGWKQNSIIVVLHYVYMIIKQPVIVLNWLTGVILFFGVMLYPFFKSISIKKYTSGINIELFILSMLGIALAILGGGDHTRIAFLSFPFFFTYILIYWKDNANGFQWVLYLIPSLYLTKFWLYLPTPTVNWEIFSRWYPEYSSFKFFPIELLISIISLIVLYFYNNNLNKKDIINSNNQ
jgi:hypothetical protein